MITGVVVGLALLAGVVLLSTKPAPSTPQFAPVERSTATAAPVPSGGPSPANSQSPISPINPNTPASPIKEVQNLPRADARVISPEIGKGVEPAQPARPASRTFTPPPTPKRGAEQRAAIDAPPTLANATGTSPVPAMPAQVPAVSPPPAIAPPAPAVVAPLPVKQVVPGPRQIKVAGNVQAGNLVKMVPPVYPPLARATRVQGTVRFTAVIGRDGKIQSLQPVSGPPPLTQAAMDAMKQWVYKPTLLNGEPVEVVTQIDVAFTLSQ